MGMVKMKANRGVRVTKGSVSYQNADVRASVAWVLRTPSNLARQMPFNRRRSNIDQVQKAKTLETREKKCGNRRVSH